jgi:hypothetical protein
MVSHQPLIPLRTAVRACKSATTGLLASESVYLRISSCVFPRSGGTETELAASAIAVGEQCLGDVLQNIVWPRSAPSFRWMPILNCNGSYVVDLVAGELNQVHERISSGARHSQAVLVRSVRRLRAVRWSLASSHCRLGGG